MYDYDDDDDDEFDDSDCKNDYQIDETANQN